MIPDNPHDIGLPHNTWRPGQRKNAQWCLDVDGVGIMEMPVGSGKTALSAACAYDHRVTALCRTKNLQVENYGALYGFNVLHGKNSYKCVHPDAQPGATCADCLHVERGEGGRGMHSCEYSGSCEYLVQKATVLGSRKASLNYAYWLSSFGVRQRPTEYLFLDECHQLPDLVLDWAGCTVNNTERSKWNLPYFPLAASKAVSSKQSLVHVEDTSTDKVVDWLAESANILESTLSQLTPVDRYGRQLPMSTEQRKRANECEHLLRKLRTVLEGLELVQDDWFVQSGPLALTWGTKRLPGLLVKPLTARYHYSRFFPTGNGSEMNKLHPRCVLMSATVGDFDTFAQELGIQQFESRRVPSQWAPERRPVYILDVPKLNYKSKPSDYDVQARAIADAILTVPSDWCGIIHVTRKSECHRLTNRLAVCGLQNRVWTPKQGSTVWMARQWAQRKRKVRGSLMVSHAFWEGMDGLDERICVVAKCPWPYLGDPYEKARQWRSHSMYNLRTAQALQQGLGRTRRGRECDYDTPSERRGLCLIADGSWRKLAGYGKGKQYLSSDFLEAIREWQK